MPGCLEMLSWQVDGLALPEALVCQMISCRGVKLLFKRVLR